MDYMCNGFVLMITLNSLSYTKGVIISFFPFCLKEIKACINLQPEPTNRPINELKIVSSCIS